MVAIAVDGPAGAGKSSISRRVAGELGFVYVDTGALYRTIGLFAVRKGIRPDDAKALTPRLTEISVELRHVEGEQRVLLNGEDVSREIRSPEMSEAASAVSAQPAVRAHLFRMQQEMAERYDVIMDGRDIGTVVLPHADVKIYLTASAEDRAERRYREYLAKGEKVSYNDILKDMKQRDWQDANREIAPLRQAEDAVLLDTSGCSFEESVELVMNTLRERGIA